MFSVAEMRKIKTFIAVSLGAINMDNDTKRILFNASGLSGSPIPEMDYILANKDHVDAAKKAWLIIFDIIQEDIIDMVEKECPGFLNLILFLSTKHSSFFSSIMPIPFYFIMMGMDLTLDVRMGKQVMGYSKSSPSYITVYYDPLTVHTSFIIDPLQERDVTTKLGLKIRVNLPTKSMCENLCKWFIDNVEMLERYNEVSFKGQKSIPLTIMFLRYKGYHMGIAGNLIFNKFGSTLAGNNDKTVKSVLDYLTTFPGDWVKYLGVKFIPFQEDAKIFCQYYDIFKKSGIEKLIKDMQIVLELYSEIGEIYKYHSTRPEIFNILFGGAYPTTQDEWDVIYEQFCDIMKYKLLKNTEDDEI